MCISVSLRDNIARELFRTTFHEDLKDANCCNSNSYEVYVYLRVAFRYNMTVIRFVSEPRHSRPDARDSAAHHFFGKMPGERTIDFLQHLLVYSDMLSICTLLFLRFSLHVRYIREQLLDESIA